MRATILLTLAVLAAFQPGFSEKPDIEQLRQEAEQETMKLNSAWVLCTTIKRETTRRRPSGTGWPPIRGTPELNSAWAFSTTMAGECRRIM